MGNKASNDVSFSIIVPVYKVEEYLSECIDSILNQNYSNYELILVDDGSPDNCPRICDMYEEKNYNVKAIHKANGGLSSARNAGMEDAFGEYIIFFDSDDCMYPNSLERLAAQLRNKPDVLITELFDTVDMTVKTPEMDLFTPPEYSSQSNVLNFVFVQKQHTWSAPQYIVKRSFVSQNRLKFEEGKYHEDVSWTFSLFLAAKTYSFYQNIWYVRRLERSGSIMNVPKAKRTIDLLEIVNQQLDNPLLLELPEKSRFLLRSRLVSSIFTSLTYCHHYSDADLAIIAQMLTDNKDRFRPYLQRKNLILFFRLIDVLGANWSLRIIGIVYHKR